LLTLVYEDGKFDIYHVFITGINIKHVKLFSFLDSSIFIYKFMWCPSKTFDILFIVSYLFTVEDINFSQYH
jgi:hypothetical protein